MKKQGFTLIELMVVVAIIGVLSAVAIPSFLRFIRKSQASEVNVNLHAISKGAISWFYAEHTDASGSPLASHFPNTDSPTQVPSASGNNRLTPSVFPCGSLSRGSMYVKNASHWEQEPWLSLHFGINKAHYFLYYYHTHHTGTSSVFGATGVADLDCDGTLSTYSIEGRADNYSGTNAYGEIELSNIYVESNALE